MPLVASITTVQTRDATVKGLVGKGKIANITQALRSRGLVNGALGLLERNKGRSQVVEIDASLLRYQRMSSQNGTDPDQGDVLEDRLIIEGVHNVLKSMRSRTARRVVTSDVNIARVLSAEGIDTLFVPTIELPEAGIPCVRYDALAKRFIGAPLRAVMVGDSARVRFDPDCVIRLAFTQLWPATGQESRRSTGNLSA
ncbi:HAD family hydrolase [Brevundimonas sp.]|uniref:HAD family hydrolase n=1 Tax=Brevundimonas sp. TaxID=1871086 RepID=UPI003AFF874E